MPTTPFAEEHVALRDSVRRHVASQLAPLAAAAEALEDVQRDAVARSGDYRALGDVVADVVVAEELGRLRSGGLVMVLLDAALLADCGLPTDGTVAVAPAADVDLRGGTATGILRFVPDGAGATACLLPAHDLVLRAGPGWVAAPVEQPHGLRGAAGVDIDVGTAAVELRAMPERATTLHDLRTAAAAVGAGWQTFDDALAYAQQRTAFGRPIGRFQTNRHALAEAATWLTAAEALVHDAAWSLATRGDADVVTPRLVAGSTLRRVSDLALQLHGGYGYTMAFDVQRAWRDARALAIGDDDRRRAVLESPR